MADRFAAIGLQNITREYPNKLDHLMESGADALGPRALHPVFYGSYDWHSAVHMHWLLVRLLRLFPGLADAPAVRSQLALHFTPKNVAVESAYLARAASATFERPYGWAWMLMLAAECERLGQTDAAAQQWAATLEPLTLAFVARFETFLPRVDYPVRAGTHSNSAFALLLCLEYLAIHPQPALKALIVQKAQQWYAQDARYPAHYEPGYDDFLSGGLTEAALMARLCDATTFRAWWEHFCPTPDALATWLTPVAVADRGDAKMSHLDGLNLSRAWCWRMVLPLLPDTLQDAVHSAIEHHLQSSLAAADGGHYVGTHWLASFATLALTADT